MVACLLRMAGKIELKQVYILILLLLNLLCLKNLLLLSLWLNLRLILWCWIRLTVQWWCLRLLRLFHFWNACSFFFIYGQRIGMLGICYVLSFNIFLSNICWNLFECSWAFWFSELGSYTLLRLLMTLPNKGWSFSYQAAYYRSTFSPIYLNWLIELELLLDREIDAHPNNCCKQGHQSPTTPLRNMKLIHVGESPPQSAQIRLRGSLRIGSSNCFCVAKSNIIEILNNNISNIH